MASVGAYLRELRERAGRLPRRDRPDHPRRVPATSRRWKPTPTTTARARLHPRLHPRLLSGARRASRRGAGLYDARDGRVPQLPARPPPAARARGRRTEPRTRGAIVVSFVLLVVLGMALFTVALVIQPGGSCATTDRGRTSRRRRLQPPSSEPASHRTDGRDGRRRAGADTCRAAGRRRPRSPTPPPAAVSPPPRSAAVRRATPRRSPRGSPAPPVARPRAGRRRRRHRTRRRPPAPRRDGGRAGPRDAGGLGELARTGWSRASASRPGSACAPMTAAPAKRPSPAGEVREWVSDRPFVAHDRQRRRRRASS